jgi:hypothetical protein
MQEHAYESSQKYKEGKFIIEVGWQGRWTNIQSKPMSICQLIHMVKDNGWAQPWAEQRRKRNGSLNWLNDRRSPPSAFLFPPSATHLPAHIIPQFLSDDPSFFRSLFSISQCTAKAIPT